jgi:hypothetical protein
MHPIFVIDRAQENRASELFAPLVVDGAPYVSGSLTDREVVCFGDCPGPPGAFKRPHRSPR